jgi:hypothetical protein
MLMTTNLFNDGRTLPGLGLDERSMLEAWLDFHRATLLVKCEGLDDSLRKARPVATSELSLHGLVRHLAEVERIWFQRVLLDDQDAPRIWLRPGIVDSVLVPLDDADWNADRSAWLAECERSRSVAAGLGLDYEGIYRSQPCTLRWIYNHMIEEYARHNGHADLIRELLDGTVGL